MFKQLWQSLESYLSTERDDNNFSFQLVANQHSITNIAGGNEAWFDWLSLIKKSIYSTAVNCNNTHQIAKLAITPV